VVIIDRPKVITGSFNFAKAAQERNAENLLALAEKALAEKHEANWANHVAHSEAYLGR
jgi:phosphatidylserine/phosphatidylglycerophosphate/cardiolipin synthase-like enzyme